MKVIRPNSNSLLFEDYLKQLIKLTSKLTVQIGYVPAIVLRESAKKNNLLLLLINKTVVGFCNYNVRNKDKIAVIYEIATHPAIRGKGGGKAMINEILKDNKIIELKCPIDNKSNKFYAKIGVKLGVEEGKKRPLNLWQITNKTVEVKNE
jgi:N-acetylglutamate synthase-like GNAT family acetyltransferase